MERKGKTGLRKSFPLDSGIHLFSKGKKRLSTSSLPALYQPPGEIKTGSSNPCPGCRIARLSGSN
jgi:hypothetical protein